MSAMNSKTLYIASGKSIKQWDLGEAKLTHLHTETEGSITALHATSSRLFYGTDTGKMSVYSIQGNRVFSLRHKLTQSINSVSSSPFKKYVAAVGDEGSIIMWDINRSLEPMYNNASVHSGPIIAISFSKSNKHIYCTMGYDRMIKIHDFENLNQHKYIVFMLFEIIQ